MAFVYKAERQFSNLELLFSTGAGIDQFDLAALPPDLPVVRMAEPGVVAGMVEYATMAVLALHRDLPAYIRQQREGRWAAHRVYPACKRRVSVLGLGVLGCAVHFLYQADSVPCHPGRAASANRH